MPTTEVGVAPMNRSAVLAKFSAYEGMWNPIRSRCNSASSRSSRHGITPKMSGGGNVVWRNSAIVTSGRRCLISRGVSIRWKSLTQMMAPGAASSHAASANAAFTRRYVSHAACVNRARSSSEKSTGQIAEDVKS